MKGKESEGNERGKGKVRKERKGRQGKEMKGKERRDWTLARREIQSAVD